MNTSVRKFFQSYPSIYKEFEKAVQAQPFYLNHYLHEEIYAREDQVVGSYNSLRDIDGAYNPALVKRLC